MKALSLVCILVSVAVGGSQGQTVTSPPPANVVFVPNPYGYFLEKHPRLPVLYLGCYGAAESKNFATYPIGPDGGVNTNEVRAFNYFNEQPTNDLFRYQVARPIVFPEERILYLAAVPSYAQFFQHTNHQEIAAIALDDAGQPGKILKAIRTSHGEKEIRGWQFDAVTRRLYMSYHSYFGWIPIAKDGLPESDRFTLLGAIQTCWQWTYVPAWRRFYARQTNGAFQLFKLAPDGQTTEYSQVVAYFHRGGWNMDASERFRKVYILDTAENGHLVIYQLTPEGRFTSVPKFVPFGDAAGIRFDFKAGRLYAWNNKALLRIYALDEQGELKGAPQLHALNCGAIRDLLIDEAGGTIYVACTEAPPPTQP